MMDFEDDLLIEQYLNDELRGDALADFKKRLDADANFRERVILEKQLRESLNPHDWSLHESQGGKGIADSPDVFDDAYAEKIRSEVAKAGESYAQQPAVLTKSRLIYMVAAAAVILILVFIGNVSSPRSSQELFRFYLEKTNHTTRTFRNNDNPDTAIQKGKQLIEAKNYEKARQEFSRLYAEGQRTSQVYIYLALTQIESGNYQEAELVLDEFIQSDLLENSRGYWYKSLLFLARGDVAQAKSLLGKIITEKLYNSELAQELLDEL